MKEFIKYKALTIKVCAFMLACFSFNDLLSQALDLSKLTPDDRKAAQAKIEAASRVDWQNMMSVLGLKTPVLVPQMDDTTRPPALTQKVVGSGYWFDSLGSQVTRTMRVTGRIMMNAEPIITYWLIRLKRAEHRINGLIREASF